MRPYNAILSDNHAAAVAIYKEARQAVDLAVKRGSILARNADREFARLVCDSLRRSGLAVPEKMLVQAGEQVARVAIEAAGKTAAKAVTGAVAAGGAVAAHSTAAAGSAITALAAANPVGAVVVGAAVLGALGYGLYKIFGDD